MAAPDLKRDPLRSATFPVPHRSRPIGPWDTHCRKEGYAMTAAAARIAIACQGGGSHTAFTAGVLGRLLKHYHQRERRLEGQPAHILGLSGTSGGAMCALLAWYALLTEDSGGASAARLLDDFWAGNAATGWWDALLNTTLVQANRLEGLLSVPELSPYTFDSFRALAPPPVRDLLDGAGRLRKLLE